MTFSSPTRWRGTTRRNSSPTSLPGILRSNTSAANRSACEFLAVRPFSRPAIRPPGFITDANSRVNIRSSRSLLSAPNAGNYVPSKRVRCKNFSSRITTNQIMPLSPARRAAFDILRRVEDEGAYASSLLATQDGRLRDDDRALCHELVLGVLRPQLWLDCVLEHFAKRPLEKIDLPVRLSLRIGLYQLRFLSRIPASAAVNESVKLVRAAGMASAASLANAILRRATRGPDYDPAQLIVDPLEKLAIEPSHPAWLID